MKITALETILFEEFPNLVCLHVHTDEGLTGLGETYFGAEAVAAWIHGVAAPALLGKNPLRIEQHWQKLNGFVGFAGSGVEMRARSAIDVALWDLLGQVCGQPIYQLLGGASRECVRVYNTCAGYRYVRQAAAGGGLPTGNWGLTGNAAAPAGPYEDLEAFLERADELAQSLLAEGITGMKIWPFDPFAERSGGQDISYQELRQGLEPFRKIRAAVGRKIDIMVELHSLWNLPTAMTIARTLEEFDPAWYEDPIKMDDLGALARFAASTRVPTAASETLATRWSFRELLERRAAGLVIYDPTWCGGISESRKIVNMAEAYQLPATAHDCVGPVSFAAAVHLSVYAPNTPIQEVVRAFYTGWYQDLVTALPAVRDGFVYPLSDPGLGTKLLPDRLARADVRRRWSREPN